MAIMREAVAEAERPVMLYSVGKDSSVMLHVARKAFYPSKPPFPLLHVDTMWKFQAMYEFRDMIAAEIGVELLVYQNPECIELGINPFTHGSAMHTDMWKTEGLKKALDLYRFDVAFGGARRDEEKSRAKERVSLCVQPSTDGTPRATTGTMATLQVDAATLGKHWCFLLTELEPEELVGILQHIQREQIRIVPLYFAAERPVVERDGTLIMVDDDRMPLAAGEAPQFKEGAVPHARLLSPYRRHRKRSHTFSGIIQEMLLATTSERQGRVIDHDSSGSMEKKKQEGYF